jgi:hypothetical protein
VVTWMEIRRVRGWSYGLWMVARQRAEEAERHDRLTLIEEETRKAAEQGLQ